jgi:AcrR family transcriptional regulator
METARSRSKATTPPADSATPRKRRAAHVARSGSTKNPVLLVKDAERTRLEILAEATREFSRNGYSGGRINEIADRTRTSKRMIYYYFGSKKGLYQAVLYEHYRRLRADEQELHLEDLPPAEAMRTLVEFTFTWFVDHADEVPLVMVENIHRAVHLNEILDIETLNTSAIDLVARIYKRGVAEGVFRPGIRPVDIYSSIAATSFFNISNRWTFKVLFRHDMTKPAELKARSEAVADMILRYVALDTPRTK